MLATLDELVGAAAVGVVELPLWHPLRARVGTTVDVANALFHRLRGCQKPGQRTKLLILIQMDAPVAQDTPDGSRRTWQHAAAVVVVAPDKFIDAAAEAVVIFPP